MSITIRIKQKIKTNRLIRPLYLRYWYFKQRCLDAEAFRNLQDKGHAVIEFIQNTLEDKVFFYFDCGTLLGIVREGKLLKHDNDIDIAVRAYEKEDITKVRELFLKKGCKLVRSFSIEGIGIVEDAFGIYGYQFDVFYIKHGSPKDYYFLMYKGAETQGIESQWNVMRLYFTPVLSLKKIDFEGLSINVPENAEFHLQEKYGDWRTPNKYFDYMSAPNSEKTDLISICNTYRKN